MTREEIIENIIDSIEEEFVKVEIPIMDKLTIFAKVQNALYKCTEIGQEKIGWIPVSKRLPEKLKDVLVAFYDCPGEYDVAYLRTTFNETYKKNGAKNEWVSSMGETTYADYEVDAWMPIEPYKAESEEE